MKTKDAFGEMILALHKGQDVAEIVERDDGYIGVSESARHYFDAFRDWPARQRQAMRFVKGRVLDVGCGAGRCALHLQEKGFEVVGIDTSPLAVRVCRERGVRDVRLMSFTQVSRKLGRFDTILMMGNNFGLFGGERRARGLLRRLYGLTSDDGRIVAESVDPTKNTDKPEHLAYHKENRRRGRMPGQVRIRVRFSIHQSDWFDYLLVSKDDVRNLVRDTGWFLERTIDPDDSRFTMVIRKRDAPSQNR